MFHFLINKNKHHYGLTIMKWENILKEKLSLAEKVCYGDLHKLCMDAYTEGHMEERALAIEAYRLQCDKLFGNRCMNSSIRKDGHKSICDGNCNYIKKYKFELCKLEN